MCASNQIYFCVIIMFIIIIIIIIHIIIIIEILRIEPRASLMLVIHVYVCSSGAVHLFFETVSHWLTAC